MTRESSCVAVASVTLEAKAAFLRRADSYPDRPGRVEAIETHTSWVFLTDCHAYKLKKPLRYEFLDFGTVEARRRNCEAEVRLNRRLARDVYLGTVPLIADPARGLELGGEGEVVDWLVKMRRLPGDRVLDRRIRERAVCEDDIAAIARVMADFYAKEPPIPMDAAEYLHRFEQDIRANRTELTESGYGLAADWIAGIADGQIEFLHAAAGLFARRIQEGKIIEAHGDLRPEHIYLGPEPVIIDCLEFNRELRILDAADELAFLAMECERLGAPFVGEVLFATYGHLRGDHPPPALLHFYRSFRASLWAKLAVRHTCRRGTGERSKWIGRTEDYLRLADAHIRNAR